MGRALGEGTFAIVYEAHARKDSSHVAIKKLKEPTGSWDACMQMRELRAFKTAGRHPNIVTLHEVVLEKPSLYFVFEFLDANLHQIISSTTAPFTEPTLRRMSSDILNGCKHLHARGYMHRDLKPENILCDAHASVLKLGDLGLARELRSRPPFTDYVATRWYRAPELCLHSTTYSSPVDVFACGCIVAEMVMRRPLLPGSRDVDMLSRMQAALGPFSADSLQPWAEGAQLAQRLGVRLAPSAGEVSSATLLRRAMPQASAPLIALLIELLAWDPSKRPSASSALSLPFWKLDLSTHRLHYAPNYLGHKPQFQPQFQPARVHPRPLPSPICVQRHQQPSSPLTNQPT